MKKFAWVGLLTVAGLLLAKGLVQAADVKVAVVDVNKIFSVYNKVTEDEVKFKKMQEERQADVEKKGAAADKEIKALQDKLDKQGSVMKKEESEKIKSDIIKKTQDKINLTREAYQDLQTTAREMGGARVKEIQAAIAKLAKEKGYTLVITKEAVVYSAPETADLSDQIIAVLNK